MASAPFSTAARAQSQSPAGASTSGRETTGVSGETGLEAGADIEGEASGRFRRGANSGCGGCRRERGHSSGAGGDGADYGAGNIRENLGARAKVAAAVADQRDIAERLNRAAELAEDKAFRIGRAPGAFGQDGNAQ